MYENTAFLGDHWIFLVDVLVDLGLKDRIVNPVKAENREHYRDHCIGIIRAVGLGDLVEIYGFFVFVIHQIDPASEEGKDRKFPDIVALFLQEGIEGFDLIILNNQVP